MIFVLYLSIQFTLTFLVFILKDPHYYDVKPDEIGSVTGALSAYAEITVIIFDLFLGVIFDTVGRIIPIVLGFIA